MSRQSLDRHATHLPEILQPSIPLEATETRFYAEDGWVFREHPGKPVECIARYADQTWPAANQPAA